MDERPTSGEHVDSADLSEGSGVSSVDTILHLIADYHRRAVLEIVSTQQSVTVAGLARRIAESEHEMDRSNIREGEIARLYLTLIHTHIPKLTNAGLVEYDEDQGTVQPTERLEQLEFPLSLVDELDGA